jgi:putative ABC transport system permease protein
MMGTLTLFVRELRFRWGTFLLGIVGVAAAVGCLTGAQAFLLAHDSQTAELVGALKERSTERMAELREEARKFSKNLGFNTMLLPSGQHLSELYAEDRSSHFITEKQVEALASAKLESLNHLRPILRQGIVWPEQERKIILVGVRGEVYIKAPRWQKPIEEAVAPGGVHVGSALAEDLKLEAGNTFTLRGRSFTVKHVMPETGGNDDISIRVDLKTAQEILGNPGKVSAILALTCACADADPSMVGREIGGIVPGIQAINFTARAQARSTARRVINAGATAEIEDIEKSRADLRAQIADFARVLVGLVALGTVLLLGALTLNNAQDRRPEIAILRALGVRTRGIVGMFLLKALAVGAVGGIVGSILGEWGAGLIAGPGPSVPIGYVLIACAAAMITAVLASLLPAAWAAKQDPAGILNQE